MIYYYTKTNAPDLDILELKILDSELSNIYESFRWDSDDNKLKVTLNKELNGLEKNILDKILNSVL
jgi:hypothetical protein